MDKLKIGIDPGVNTGFAVWDSKAKKFYSLQTLSFWKAIELLDEIRHRMIMGFCKAEVVIEDPNKNKAMFFGDKRAVNDATRLKTAQNVGMNKRDAQLIREWCETNAVEVKLVKPSTKKWDQEFFEKITGHKSRVSQHARDAAKLIFGL